MNYKGVLKRLLPFAATFLVAVFITSFFVDLHRPRFGGYRDRRWGCRGDADRITRENEELRNENLRLRNEIENRGFDSMDELKLDVPAPPVPPVAPAARRFK